MIIKPVSNCVYTDVQKEELGCVYRCNIPLCNHTVWFYTAVWDIFCLLFVH